MAELPTAAQIADLHRKYAPSQAAFDSVFTHCRIVAAIAGQLLAKKAPDGIDVDLVRAGCLLHDIGVYRLYREDGKIDRPNYVRHGILGHEILAAEGFDDVLARFCSCHTGVGLTKKDIKSQHLPIPMGSYVAVTTEERLVMYADKFHSKSSPMKFLTSDAYSKRLKRFGKSKVALFETFREEFGEPDPADLPTSFDTPVT